MTKIKLRFMHIVLCHIFELSESEIFKRKIKLLLIDINRKIGEENS